MQLSKEDCTETTTASRARVHVAFLCSIPMLLPCPSFLEQLTAKLTQFLRNEPELILIDDSHASTCIPHSRLHVPRSRQNREELLPEYSRSDATAFQILHRTCEEYHQVFWAFVQLPVTFVNELSNSRHHRSDQLLSYENSPLFIYSQDRQKKSSFSKLSVEISPNGFDFEMVLSYALTCIQVYHSFWEFWVSK